MAPSTRDDWKLLIVAQPVTALNIPGNITAGKGASGDAYSASNVFNAVSMPIQQADAGKLIYVYSGTFSATLGDQIHFYWEKTSSVAGTATKIFGIYLVY